MDAGFANRTRNPLSRALFVCPGARQAREFETDRAPPLAGDQIMGLRIGLRRRKSNPSSVNFGRPLERLFQSIEAEVLAARDVQDRRFAAAAEFGGVRN